jgi:hypothetical protein
MKLPRGQRLALSALLGLTGCASIRPPLPPTLELPRPPLDLRAARKGDKVSLSWTIPARTMDRQKMLYLGETNICRSLNAVLTKCDTAVGEVSPPPDFASKNAASGEKLTATFIDTLPLDLGLGKTFDSATYAVEVLNRGGRAAGLSNQVHIPLAETLPAPTDLRAQVTAQGAVLTWTGVLLSPRAGDPLHLSYRVYRREEGSQKEVLVGEKEAGIEKNLSVSDQSFVWQKTYYYRVTTFTMIEPAAKAEVSVEGDDTPEVKIFADDVFPPAAPAGLQAVFSGPGQRPFIDLIWAPVAGADLGGYNIYRHEAGSAPVRVNSELVKIPAFRDAQVASGKKYFYSVSAVDLRGNESARSEEANESVP